MPNQSRGRSRPIRGRATLTTVESRNTMPDPSTAATRIQRRRSVMSSLLRSWQILKRARNLCLSESAEQGRCCSRSYRDVVQPNASPTLAQVRVDPQRTVDDIQAQRGAKREQRCARRPGLRTRGGGILDGRPGFLAGKAGKDLGQPVFERGRGLDQHQRQVRRLLAMAVAAQALSNKGRVMRPDGAVVVLDRVVADVVRR